MNKIPLFYADYKPQTAQCCHVKASQLEFHERFKQKVDHHEMCYKKSSMAEANAEPADKKMKDQFKKNFFEVNVCCYLKFVSFFKIMANFVVRSLLSDHKV